MGRGRSGRTAASIVAQSRATDADYNAGGSGLLGSNRFSTIQQANDFFGVRYTQNSYTWGSYDNDASNGAFKDWYENTTPEERQGAITYTGYQYREINKYLRDKKLASAPTWIKEAVAQSDSAMTKFVLPQAITVWRGGSNKLVGGATTVAQLNAMTGTVVTDRGITSTSVTKEHAWGTGGGKIGYEIVYPKGRGRGVFIDPVSSHHGEQEFMAARNTRYEVLGGYRDEEGRVICRLKAIY